MNYTAEHIDPEKFEAGLDSQKRYQEELQRTAIEKANAMYEGYCKCLEDVRSMLHCSNYEKSEGDFERGVFAALDNLLQQFGVIFTSKTPDPVSEKAMEQIKKIKEWLIENAWGNRINRAYENGVNNALEDLCRRFRADFQDVLSMGTSLEEKTALISKKVWETMRKEIECLTWVCVTERLPEDDQERKGMLKKVIVWARGKWFECSFDPKTKKFIRGFGCEQYEVEGVDYWAIPAPPRK